MWLIESVSKIIGKTRMWLIELVSKIIGKAQMQLIDLTKCIWKYVWNEWYWWSQNVSSFDHLGMFLYWLLYMCLKTCGAEFGCPESKTHVHMIVWLSVYVHVFSMIVWLSVYVHVFLMIVWLSLYVHVIFFSVLLHLYINSSHGCHNYKNNDAY